MSATRRIDKPSEAFAFAASGDVPATVRRRVQLPDPSRPWPTIGGNTTVQILWMSTDGLTFFGANGTQLIKSTDDGLTWTNVGAAFPTTVLGVRLLADGQLLVSTSLVTAITPGKLWKSAGYPSAPVFTNVLTAASPGAYFPGEWSLSFREGVVVACEYGNKNPPNDVASKAYLSTDSGVTWKTVFTHAQEAGVAHIHSAAFDPVWERLWVATGDSQHRSIQYSDDFGATWTPIFYGIASSPNVVGFGSPQATSILPMPNGIVFGSDSPPNGLFVAWRRRKEDTPYLVTLLSIESADSVSIIGATPYCRGEGYPALIPFIRDISGPGYLAMVSPNGLDAHVVWKDTASYATPGGLTTAFGPTATGKIIGSRRVGADFQRFELTAPTWVNRSLSAPQRKLKRHLRLNGSAAGNARTPDAANFALASDFDLRIRLAMDDWTPVASQAIAAQYSSAGASTINFFWLVLATGQLQFLWYPDGVTLRVATSTVAPTVADGDSLAVRVVIDKDNGAGQHAVSFYTSMDYDTASKTGTWTQLGTTITGATGPTSFNNAASVLEIGATENGAGNRLIGRVEWLEWRDGIDGVVVADPDFRGEAWQVGDTPAFGSVNTPTARDSRGNVWTLAGQGVARIEASAVFDDAPYVNVPTLPAAAADAATTQALVNAIRKALINMEAAK